MRLIAFPQWDKLTSLLRGMARQSAADYAQRKSVRIIPKNDVAHFARAKHWRRATRQICLLLVAARRRS